MGMYFRKKISDPIAVDIGNIVTQGHTVSKTIQLASFTTNRNAVWASKKQLQKESYPFAFVDIVVNRNLFRLQPGDCFKFSYSNYGISNMICRVLSIEEEDISSEKITIHAMEDIFGVSSAITEFTNPEDNTTDPPSYELEPFVNQRIIEAPYVLSESIRIIPIACRTGDRDLGFDVNMSVDGGDSYTLIDRCSNLQPYGTLIGSYFDDTYTIDTEVGFTIDFLEDVAQIETITWTEVFSASDNLAILGDEIISFQSITPVSGTQYKLEGIIRGRFDTQKVSHAEGETFYYINTYITMIANAELLVGVGRKFKLVPYNNKYSGDISEATPIDITLEGRSKKPYAPINFAANGGSFAARYTSDIVLTWSYRYRGKGAGIGSPGIVLSDADIEGLFEIEVWVLGIKKRTTTAIDEATWTYTEAMNISDNGAIVLEPTFKLLNYRVEDGVTYQSDQVEVICYNTSATTTSSTTSSTSSTTT